jgi:hypothetical protein
VGFDLIYGGAGFGPAIARMQAESLHHNMRQFLAISFFTLCLAGTSLAGDLAFRKHVINADSEFMAAAVFDVNKDGRLDIVCGGFWYEAPTWKKHFLRNVETINGRPDGYAHQVLDVNGDGWPDLITVNWRSRSVRWIEHPGADLFKEQEWKTHVIATPGNMETGRLVDLLGDGTPCILPSTVPFWWELARKADGPQWIQHDLPPQIAGHGVGFGDINGDGRGDIVGHAGWLEAPQDRRSGQWIWHADFELGVTSVPILVVDVDGDGLNDIVWTMGHDYGVYWLQQTRDKAGKIGWTKHAIDTSWAGSHAPLWVDLDGDGTPELVVGRRYKAHEGADPGEFDPQAIYRYQFDRKTRTWRRYIVSYNDGTCFGLDPVAVDLTGSGRLDLVFGGRHGLYWLENLGKGSSVAQHETHDPMWFPTYADHLNLMVVKDESGQERAVKDAFDIGQRRAQTLAAMQAVMGPLPDSHQRVPLDVRVESETDGGTYVRRKISYGCDLSSRVTADLLIPKEDKRDGPAMICLYAPAADELAKRGFVCLVPDYLSHDGAIKAVWNIIRGIDLLETTPQVHRKRIGIMGHGIGGRIALLAAAFDYRISATVCSAGLTTFTRYHGGDLTDWADDRLMPRVRDVYQLDPAKIPFDFAEVLASLAPRAVCVIAPQHDPVMDAQGARQAVAAASAVYQFKRAADALKLVTPDNDGADFPADARADVTAWLEQRLSARNTIFRSGAN